jgi:hypothetical protein
MGKHLLICIDSNITYKIVIILITLSLYQENSFWTSENNSDCPVNIYLIISMFLPFAAVAGCELESVECLQQDGSYVSGELAFRGKESNSI